MVTCVSRSHFQQVPHQSSFRAKTASLQSNQSHVLMRRSLRSLLPRDGDADMDHKVSQFPTKMTTKDQAQQFADIPQESEAKEFGSP